MNNIKKPTIGQLKAFMIAHGIRNSIIPNFIDDMNNIFPDMFKVVEDINNPYLIRVKEYKVYNSNYGDDRMCICGHPYYRHFDSYDNNDPIGCKYCECHNFTEKIKE